jgi:hypothetical protein
LLESSCVVPHDLPTGFLFKDVDFHGPGGLLFFVSARTNKRHHHHQETSWFARCTTMTSFEAQVTAEEIADKEIGLWKVAHRPSTQD